MPASLTAILHEDAKNAPSGLDMFTIAKLLGRKYATLMSELGRQPGHKFGADLVLPLMRLTGSDNGITYLARELCGEFVRIPDHWRRRRPSERQLVQTVKEFAEFIRAVTDAYLDGKITAGEFQKARADGRAAVAAILVLLDLMENDMDEEERP